MVLVAVWLGFATAPSRGPLPGRPGSTDIARLAAISGQVEFVTTDGDIISGQAWQTIPAGAVVRTLGEDSAATVEFPDRSRLDLQPDTTVKLEGEAAGAARKVQLVHGGLSASVARRDDELPTVVSAGPSDFVARNAVFDIWSTGDKAARVELVSGDVAVRRGHEPAAMTLTPSRPAFLPGGEIPVRIEPLFQVEREPRESFDFPGALDLIFTLDGKELWAASAKQWQRLVLGQPVSKANPLRTLYTGGGGNDGVAALFARQGRLLLTCLGDDREDRILVRELPNSQDTAKIPIRVAEQRHLAVAPDGGWLATYSKPERTIRLWDRSRSTVRWAWDAGTSVFCMEPTPDCRALAVELTDLGHGTKNRVVLLDADTGQEMASFPTQKRVVTAMAFRRDGRMLAAATNGRLQIWDVAEKKVLRTIEGFERTIHRLAFSPDGQLIAAGMGDGQVWIWSAQTGQRTQVVQNGTRGVRSLTFSADGKSLATATNRAGVAIWDISTPDAVPAGPEF